MTTYKLVLIPDPPTAQSGVNSTSTGVMMNTSADDRYKPFGHLPKEYVQVRRSNQLFFFFAALGQGATSNGRTPVGSIAARMARPSRVTLRFALVHCIPGWVLN